MPARWLTAAVAALLLGPAAARADIPVVELDGVVHAITAAHVVQAIDRADAAGAPLVVVRMDTPGGLDSSMRQIIDRMLSCRTPVAVWVGPSGARGASAGFVILDGRGRRGHGSGHERRGRAPRGRPRPDGRDHVEEGHLGRGRLHPRQGGAPRQERGDGGEGGGREQVLHREGGARAEAHRPRGEGRPRPPGPAGRARGEALRRDDGDAAPRRPEDGRRQDGLAAGHPVDDRAAGDPVPAAARGPRRPRRRDQPPRPRLPRRAGRALPHPLPVREPDHSRELGRRAARPARDRPLRGRGEGGVLRPVDRRAAWWP